MKSMTCSDRLHGGSSRKRCCPIMQSEILVFPSLSTACVCMYVCVCDDSLKITVLFGSDDSENYGTLWF